MVELPCIWRLALIYKDTFFLRIRHSFNTEFGLFTKILAKNVPDTIMKLAKQGNVAYRSLCLDISNTL